MEPSVYLMLAVLGGFVGLDNVSWTQTMISRPIVAAPLAGMLLGVPEQAMWAGVLLEILSLRQLPVGAARHWDVGPAAVAAAAAVAVLPTGTTALAIAVGFGALVGWLGSASVHLMRQFNSRLVVFTGPVAPLRLSVGHLVAMAGDFVRAATLTAIAVYCIAWLSSEVGAASRGEEIIAALLLLIALSLSCGVLTRTMASGRAAWSAFALGALASSVVWLWLG